MCHTTVERLFDRILPTHTRKVASLFAQALRRIRKERGWSQDNLARRIPQVSASTLRAMDRGEHLPNARTLLHVARALNVSMEELLEGAEIRDTAEPAKPAMA
jgi:transcriptional regulator with XRE-family HTH domain